MLIVVVFVKYLSPLVDRHKPFLHLKTRKKNMEMETVFHKVPDHLQNIIPLKRGFLLSFLPDRPFGRYSRLLIKCLGRHLDRDSWVRKTRKSPEAQTLKIFSLKNRP